MKNKQLYLLWGGLYLLSVGLSLIEKPGNLLQALMFFVALGFFVPGALLLYRGYREKNAKVVASVRWISAGSLCITLLLLVANVLSVAAPRMIGNIAYALLVLFSAPMICSRIWVISLFLWACLFMASRKKA